MKSNTESTHFVRDVNNVANGSYRGSQSVMLKLHQAIYTDTELVACQLEASLV